jgi:hypothetical protein
MAASLCNTLLHRRLSDVGTVQLVAPRLCSQKQHHSTVLPSGQPFRITGSKFLVTGCLLILFTITCSWMCLYYRHSKNFHPQYDVLSHNLWTTFRILAVCRKANNEFPEKHSRNTETKIVSTALVRYRRRWLSVRQRTAVFTSSFLNVFEEDLS